MPGRDQRHSGLEGDPRRARVRAARRASSAAPSARLVPSGNIATTCPSRASSIAVCIASSSALPRRTLKPPQADDQPAERRPEELRLRHEAQKAVRARGSGRAATGRNSRCGPRRSRSLRRAADARFRRPDSGRRCAGSATTRARSVSRTDSAWVGVSSAASIAHAAHGAIVARRWQQEKPLVDSRLVIVESPAKAKTIAGYLGDGYIVESSIGHIRDLPNSASEIPTALKGEAWARLGVDVDKDFEPLYVVDSRRKNVVADLKAKLKNADELLLATDEDREGEAIAWHLVAGAEADGAGAAHGLPRDHAARDRAGAHRDARDRRAPRRRAGDPPHPRPPVRLRGFARPVAQGDAGPVRRPRAVGRDAPRRRARARADGVRRRRVLGHRRHARPGRRSRPACRRSRAARSPRAATSAATASCADADVGAADRG